MESEKLKEIYKELKSFCKENNIETGKSGYLMGLFTKYHRALSQHDVSGRSELLFDFIAEIKLEFSEQNWDYLDFIAERVIGKQ